MGERAEEALDHRVVSGVARAAHAARQPVLLGLLHVLVVAVDAAAVRVHDAVARFAARLERARERREAQLAVLLGGHRAPDNAAREEVDHRCQVQPTGARTHVLDVRDPLSAWCPSDELPVEPVRRDSFGRA